MPRPLISIILLICLIAVLCNGQSKELNLRLLRNLNRYTDVIKGLATELRSKLDTEVTIQHLLVNDLIVSELENQLLHIQLGSFRAYYKNKKWLDIEKGQYCDDVCQYSIENLPTRSSPDCSTIAHYEMIHTEVLYMYGNWGRALLSNSRNIQRITLLYSLYIPCADNCHSCGECAGEMAYYRSIQEAGHRNYFIVVYSGVYPKTSESQSMLYQTMGGIPVIHLESSSDKIQNPYYDLFLEAPMFFRLPRGIRSANDKHGDGVEHSRLGLIAKCLEGFGFLDELLSTRYWYFWQFADDRRGLGRRNIQALHRADMYIYIEWIMRKQLFDFKGWERVGKDLYNIYKGPFPTYVFYLCISYVNGLKRVKYLPDYFNREDMGRGPQGLDEFLQSLGNNRFASLQREIFNSKDLQIENERLNLETKYNDNRLYFMIEI